MATGVQSGVSAVQTVIPYPGKQSRLLLFVRGFLLIPHWFMAIAVLIVAGFMVFLNYVMVLFTGKAAFFDFLSGTLRYLTRLQAYASFLTDAYPPFSLSGGDYPLGVVVAQPERIGRLRFFSSFLVFPHYIALYVLFIVQAFCTFIGWFAILFTGHFPESLFNFSAATIRYQARVNAYVYLIADGYPPFSME